MLLKVDKSAVIIKTEELCQAILEQASFKELKQKINAFMSDEKSKTQYQNLINKQNMLKEKQQQGMSLTDDDVQEFEREKQALLDNPVAKGFIDAQQEIHKVEETVSQYVSKTFDLERVPTEDDFQQGDCGPSCGCH